MLLSLHHDYVMLHTFQPLAPDRTHVTCEFLFHPDTLANPVRITSHLADVAS